MKKVLLALLLSPLLSFGQATGTAISNKPTGGSIGTAATTVDVSSKFNVNQTTAGQTLTIPNPTNRAAGPTIYVRDTGTVSFTLIPGGAISVGSGATLGWTGNSWNVVGSNTSGGGGGTPGGANTQLQYNNSGVFGGISGVTTNGSQLALGIPISGTATNLTGLPLNTGVAGILPIANGGSNASTIATARINFGIDNITNGGNAAYNILATDKVVYTGTAFTASRIWTLPDASTVNPGYEIIISDFLQTATSSNTLTIAVQAGQKLNGATNGTEVIITAGGWRRLISDGISNWSYDAGIVRLAGTQALTNKDLTSGTNTFPTFNQNTTGSAAKLTIARNIGGIPFDGTANITVATATGGFTVSGGNLVLTAAQFYSAFVTLTDGATINTDCNTGMNFKVTLGGNRTLANPTNLQDGATYTWKIKQDGTGSRLITFGSKFDFGVVGLPTLTITAGTWDYIVGIYDSVEDKISCTWNGGF